jgi:hypothetical protein
VALAAQKRKANDPNGAAQAEKEAFATFDELVRDRSVRDASSRALDLIHFKYGEAYRLPAYRIVPPKSSWRRQKLSVRNRA